MAKGFQLVARGIGDLKTRYRPQRLDEAAPTFPIRRLKKIVTDPNASQVYLFEGPTGTGKTSCARILARASVCEGEGSKPCLKCETCVDLEKSPDFVEINVANFRKIDDIRSIIDGMRYRPSYLPRKIYIFDEVHQLTADSQQLLLKVLEEPPPEVLVFMCTTEKTGIKKTLLHRTTEIKFKRLQKTHALKIIEQVLTDVAATGVDMQQEVSEELRLDLYRRSDGSVRLLLNHLQAYFDGDYKLGEEEEGEVSAGVRELANALLNKRWGDTREKGVEVPGVASILKDPSAKKAPESLRIGVTSYLRAICLNRNSVGSATSAAFALGQLSGTLAGQPPVEQYNQLVLRCLRACYQKK